ncbi:MAG: tyrosine-type recombinase/integrase, partial [Huintestinicola sp.]
MARRGENIYKRKDGRWEGRYKNGFKPDGKAKYSSVYGKSYAEVKAIMSEKRIKPDEKIIPHNLTVKKIFEIWFDAIKLRVKESTYTSYFMKYEKHILLSFGDMRYDELSADKLNSFVYEKRNAGLSDKYISDIIGVIKAACRFASQRFGYADNSRYIIISKAKPAEKEMLNTTAQTDLRNYLFSNPTSSNVGILLSMATGIRIGELCALKWSDIDLEKKIITVRHTLQRIKNFFGSKATKLIITAPKTNSSAREIPIPEFILPILKRLETASENFLLSGTDKIIEPRTLQYRFKSILNRLNIPYVSFHSLRHLFATNCIALGFDVKTLSEILGHSSVEITLNRYVHSSIERKAECMKLLSN